MTDRDERAVEENESKYLAMCKDGDVEAVRAALSRVTSVNTVGRFKQSALSIACQNPNEDVALFLLDQQPDPLVTNTAGLQAIHFAANTGKCRVVDRLLTLGVDVNVQRRNRHTPLLMALQNNQIQMVEYLLSRGAKLSLPGKDGNTVLHLAWNQSLTAFFLEHGAGDIVNSPNVDGETALHKACCQGDVLSAKLLLDAGAHIEQADRSGDTPLLLAAKECKFESVVFLLDEGADFAAANNKGKTLEKLAKKDAELRQLLEARRARLAVGVALANANAAAMTRD